MPPRERQKLLNLQAKNDRERIKKYIFKKWQDLYCYHENPNNPDGWDDCFLQRKYDQKTDYNETLSKLFFSASTIWRWRKNSQNGKKFDNGKSAHVLLPGRPSGSKDTADKDRLI